MTAYITEKERYTIEGYLKINLPVARIAKCLEKARSTIYKEIARGKVSLIDSNYKEHLTYCADYAQIIHREACANKGKLPKLLKDVALMDYIEDKILNHYSPDAVIGELKHRGKSPGICSKTIYNGIKKGLFKKLDKTSLPYRSHKKAEKKQESDAFAKKKAFRTMITERPDYISDRTEFGHWEMDLVCCRKSKECLFVLVERLSRYSLIFKLASGSQSQVKRVMDFLEMKFGDMFQQLFKSFTTDNGPEFLDMDSKL